jgi:hypothetical protein
MRCRIHRQSHDNFHGFSHERLVFLAVLPPSLPPQTTARSSTLLSAHDLDGILAERSFLRSSVSFDCSDDV